VTVSLGKNRREMKQPNDPESVEAIAERLIRLRTALGYADSQAAFAALVEISPQAWNNYETCDRRIDIDQARKVCRKTGVTRDWIYDGNVAGLPLSLAQRLGEPYKGTPRKRA